jgi:hypothetical protein
MVDEVLADRQKGIINHAQNLAANSVIKFKNNKSFSKFQLIGYTSVKRKCCFFILKILEWIIAPFHFPPQKT